MSALLASDLDRTLVYSAAAAGVPVDGLLAVEHVDGRPVSFLTHRAAALLERLGAEHLVVPVTTRSREQAARVVLPGRPPRFAVVANGGVLLVDGEPDPEWAARVREAVDGVAPLAQACSELAAALAGRPARTRSVEELFCYAVVERSDLPPGAPGRLAAWARGAGWTVSLQGRKLYLVPRPLTKSAAVLEVARRTGAAPLLAAGDSLLDADLLRCADRAVRPGHGELADRGWHAPGVEALPSTGVRAGEDILDWFTASTRECAA